MTRVTSPATARAGYTDRHARAGLDVRLPDLETWPNQFPGYEIRLDFPEFTSVCPKTNLPDFGTIVIRYRPGRRCLEMKSLKLYLGAYRNLGIFNENVVNRILRDVVRATRPAWCEVRGDFTSRGGITNHVTARQGRVPDAV